AVRLSLSWLHVRWLAWGRRVIPADLAAKSATLGERLGLRFPPRVCVSEKIREAIVVGLWRPLVLLPTSWLTEMTPEVLEAVIAHELAHVRRLDLWVNLLQRLMETLLFYHPAIWWLSRRVGLEREMCADELAVGATGERLVYVTALEQLGRIRLGQTASQFGASMGGNKMVLLNRVGNILGLSASNRRARWWPVGLLALAVPLAIWLASTSIVWPTENETRAEEVVDDTAAASTSEGVGGETEKEASWGEPVEGVHARLRAEKTTWKVGEPVALKVDVRNRGSRNLAAVTDVNYDAAGSAAVRNRFYSVADGPAFRLDFDLEVDGQRFRQRRGWSGHLPFGPGDEYESVPVSLDRFWRAVGHSTADLHLEPGKHTIRAVFTGHPVESAQAPVLAVSNPVKIEIVPGRLETSGSNEAEDYPAAVAAALPQRPRAVLDAYFRWVAEREGDRDEGSKLRKMLCFVDKQDERWFVAFGSHNGEIYVNSEIFPTGKPVECKRASDDCWLVVLDGGVLLELWRSDGKWRVLCPTPGRLRRGVGKRTEATRPWHSGEVQKESEAQLQRRRARYLAVLELSGRHRLKDMDRYFAGIPTTDPATLAGMSLDEFRKAVLLKLDAPFGLRYRVTAEAKSFGQREPVWVTFLIENVTDKPIKLKYRPSVKMLNRSAPMSGGVRVFPKGYNVGDPGMTVYPFKESEAKIPPGQTYSTRVDLRKYYVLPSARYRISARFYAPSGGAEGFWHGSAVSNMVWFEIGPVTDPVQTKAESAPPRAVAETPGAKSLDRAKLLKANS
ncbi:MAG: M56 family metallopeptidase, partial [Planctomycetota bacterium]